MSKVAVVFPGQGQGTLKNLLLGLRDGGNLKEITRHYLKLADKILGENISSLIENESKIEEIRRDTRLSQLVVYIVSYIWWKVLNDEGEERYLNPAVYCGHSLGLVTAASAAGSLTYEDGLILVNERGSLMKKSCQSKPGAMVVLFHPNLLEIMALPTFQLGVNVASYNFEDQVSLAGPRASIAEIVPIIEKRKLAKRTIPLETQGAFHCDLMKDAEESFRKHLSSVKFLSPRAPILPNSCLGLITSPEALREELVILTKSVLWHPLMRFLREEVGIDDILEVGPGNVLSEGLQKSQDRKKKHLVEGIEKGAGAAAVVGALFLTARHVRHLIKRKEES